MNWLVRFAAASSVLLLVAVAACQSATPTALPTAIPVEPTATSPPPTATATAIPPTATPVPPTATAVPPTATTGSAYADGLLLRHRLPLRRCLRLRHRCRLPLRRCRRRLHLRRSSLLLTCLGREVVIPAIPTKIVSISPTATETLYAVGGVAVARDRSSIYPESVNALPEIGGAYNPSFEAIVSHRPDLILFEALSQAQWVEALEELGVPIVAVRAASLEDVTASLELVGSIIGNVDAAADAAARISADIEAAGKGVEGELPAVLIIIGDQQRNLYVAESTSYPGAVLSALGLTNLGGELSRRGPFPGFSLVTQEQLLEMDPDVIFTISPAPPPAPKMSTALGWFPALRSLRALQNKQVYEIDPILFLRNQGPRISDAVIEMAEILKGIQ